MRLPKLCLDFADEVLGLRIAGPARLFSHVLQTLPVSLGFLLVPEVSMGKGQEGQVGRVRGSEG